MYTSKRGRSGSTRPVSKRAPPWVKYAPEEVEAAIVKAAREGNSPSVIGMILRDKYGIPLAKYVTQKTITELLKSSGQAPRMPEDLDTLLKKAERLRKHLERNRKDYPNKRSLAGAESKIHRLVKFYKSRGVLEADWKYKPFAASVE